MMAHRLSGFAIVVAVCVVELAYAIFNSVSLLVGTR